MTNAHNAIDAIALLLWCIHAVHGKFELLHHPVTLLFHLVTLPLLAGAQEHISRIIASNSQVLLFHLCFSEQFCLELAGAQDCNSAVWFPARSRRNRNSSPIECACFPSQLAGRIGAARV